LLATLLTATVIAAGFAHAWRSQRQAVRDDRGEVGHGEVGHGEVGRGAAGSWQRRATLSRIGMLLSLLAALAVGFTLVPLLLLEACPWSIATTAPAGSTPPMTAPPRARWRCCSTRSIRCW